jgi:hypothetical protein
LKSPGLLELCGKYGASTLQEIHASFGNIDRISAILQKERLFSYPKGKAYNGLLYELQRNPSLKVSSIF